MEGYSSSIFPFQLDDQVPIVFPDLSIWDDFGFNHNLDPPKVFGNFFENNELRNNLHKVDETNPDVEKQQQHREIERQRRKEMADLYSSLRSLLPSKSIKGTRSASDQIHEATKYIRWTQNKVRQLKVKRDNMKKKVREDDEKVGFLREKGSSSSKNLDITVRVQQCSVGVEVLISCDFVVERRSLRLSRILQLLLEEGLNVVDCNCSKHNGSLNYMIQSEVQTCPSINLQMLQEKLNFLINQQRN